ncbi:MAG: DUF4783 domain-containing protein [Bacteroidetes bacterium]|nr:MAG: DUF4783 domain-containing protein [Bacteroidota bacterium]
MLAQFVLIIRQLHGMRTIALLMSFVFWGAVSVSAQSVSEVVTALKQANADKVTDNFDSVIDLKMPEKAELKSIGKTQASVVLSSFFDQSKITGFEMGSQRELASTVYITGKLQSTEKTYNITIMLKTKGDKQQIITVRIG